MPINGVVEFLYVLSPYLTNGAKFGFDRATYNTSDLGSPYQPVTSTGPGLGFVSQNSTYNSTYVGNTFSEIDDLTWIHGRHTLKTRLEIREMQLNHNSEEHGTVTFATLQALRIIRYVGRAFPVPCPSTTRAWV